MALLLLTIPKAVGVHGLCALQRLVVATSASSSGSDQNGSYYIAVEPWPAAMALLSIGLPARALAHAMESSGQRDRTQDRRMRGLTGGA